MGHAVAQDLLPKKADLIEFEKVALELKDHFRRILDLGVRRFWPLQEHHCIAVLPSSLTTLGIASGLTGTEGKGLPPELLEALRMLKGMEGLKDLVKAAGAFSLSLRQLVLM